jgi:hypothetical protein
MITAGSLSPHFLGTAQHWSGLLFLTAVSSLGHWTSSSFQSCCTQRRFRWWSCSQDMTRRWLLPRLKSSWRSCLNPATPCSVYGSRITSKTARLSRFLPQRFNLPHPAQEIPLQTIYCVKILASESRLAPSSRNSTAIGLCQDSCLSSRN